MNNYKLSTYDLPGLADMGTLRLPIENAPVAQNWLESQGARLIGSSPVRGSNEQVIRFEDPSYQEIINRLRQKASDVETVYFGEPSSLYGNARAKDITEEGYIALQNLKASQAPKDFIDKLSMELNRQGQTDQLVYGPSQYENMLGAYQKMGVPLEVVDQDTLIDRLKYVPEYEELSPDQVKKLDPRSYYKPGKHELGTLFLSNPYPDQSIQAQKTTPRLVKDFRNLITTDEYFNIQNSDLAREGNLYYPQVQSDTYQSMYGMKPVYNSPEHILDIHNAATEFEINKRLFQGDPKMQAIAFEQARNTIANAPMPRGGWRKGTSPLEYLAQPEFRNQIRTAGRFAGSLFA